MTSSCQFIPPFLLQNLARSQADAAPQGSATLRIDDTLRRRRLAAPPVVPGAHEVTSRTDDDAWTVYTAANGSELPGSPVRTAGAEKSGDLAVDEAYAGTEASLALFAEVFSRQSYDGRGAPVVVTVHYEQDYANAFWDGRQLVFGDGDGKVFDRFTKPIDVLAHEFTHAVVQHTAGLTYEGQPGALNESMSDVFGSLVKQRVLGQDAASADWLIGEGIFLPAVRGTALRSLSAPGTAYDDPALGRDPQVGSMADYVETTDDNGGVHINSGIPNRAFHLASSALGGHAWEAAGPIWYAALTSPAVSPDTDFAGFAQATIEAAPGPASAAVADAWEQVGVTPVAGSSTPAPSPRGAGGQVSVRRSGGFAGQVVTGAVELGADPRTGEVEQLLARIDLAAVHSTRPQPDRFVYAFSLQDREVVVAEQDLTPELSRLAHVVLDEQDR